MTDEMDNQFKSDARMRNTFLATRHISDNVDLNKDIVDYKKKE